MRIARAGRLCADVDAIVAVAAFAVRFQLLLKRRQPASDQVDVLQHDPVALFRRQVESLLGDHLLTLAEGDVVKLLVVDSEPEFLSECFDFFEWIDAGRENEEHGRFGAALFVRFGEFDGPVFDVLRTEFLFHENPKFLDTRVSLRQLS